MGSPPLVTIGIPTVRRLGYLREAVESALAQTHPQVEVLISQDPGEHGLDEAVATWGAAQAATNPRIRYHAHASRQGLGGNMNATAALASGQYLTLIGDDDRLLPEFVATLLAAVESSGADVAFCSQWFIDASGTRLPATTNALNRHYGRERLQAGLQADPVSCVWRNSVPLSAALIRTKVVARFPFPHDTNAVDIGFFARLAAGGGQFTFVPARLADYRVHPGAETAAGLQYEALIEHLRVIAVPPGSEAIKREFLESAVYAATRARLLRGEMPQARLFLHHEYYPQGRAAQRILVRLPAPLGTLVMRSYQGLRRALAKSPT